MDHNTPLLSEIFRPQNLAELTLPDQTIKNLIRLTKSGSMMNLVFYGRPGIGKTSAARILLDEINADVREFNGSHNKGDKSMINEIEGFAYHASLYNKQKICFIDEADYMPKTVQNALRYIIEKSSSNCRFLMTANDISLVTPAIKSRCLPICFDVAIANRSEILKRMVEHYSTKLSELDCPIDKDRISEIVHLYFPDFRSIANSFQMEI